MPHPPVIAPWHQLGFEELITPLLFMVPDATDVRKVEIASLFTEPVLVKGPRVA
ncbi:MAG: hypothetical protein ACREUW_14495 [Burkholderiales bacterium]